MVRRYFWNLLIALDQGMNAVLGGDPDETISSRAGKLIKRRRWACVLCRLLSLIDKRHCQKNVEADEGDNAAITD